MRLAIVLLLVSAVAAGESRRVTVTSTPPNAEVSVDGKVVGRTPHQISLPEKGKTAVKVTARGYADFKKVLVKERDGTTLHVKLVDVELESLKKALKKASKAYDAANTKLESAQAAANDAPSDKADRVVEQAEDVMQQAAEHLEEAQNALRSAEQFRKSENERAEEAARTRAAASAATPAESGKGSWAKPAAAADFVVYCLYDVPLPDKSVETYSYCTSDALAKATETCTRDAKTRNTAALACNCTDDPGVIGSRCKR